MPQLIFKRTAFLITALAVFAVTIAVSTSAEATCYGSRYDYFETPACINIVGTKVSCPGYPDQYDTGPDGSYTVTPWYTVQQVTCPCPTGGGGSNGGAEDEESEAP
jgi:hypothetical protein